MWGRVRGGCGGRWRVLLGRRMMSSGPPSVTASAVVNSVILRALKDHYLEVSKMTPPPKVSPPSPFSIVKGSLDADGPVLKRSYGDEEISIYVMRLANIIPGGEEEDDDINQLFLHVDVSKPGQKDCLHFLCGLYPDALGIHSVSMRPATKLLSSGVLVPPTQYSGPVFQDLDEKMRDALHSYIEERGVNESLFPFLQAWLYVRDHRNLMHWFKRMGTFISGQKPSKDS